MEVGILLGLPNVAANLIEPWLGILADVWKRRAIILGGGAAFAGGLALFAVSPSFLVLLLASTVMSPASGAFVGLSQATLMDLEPARHEGNMARWTLAGSVGAVAGPLALGAAIALGLGWRGLFAAAGTLALAVLALAWWRSVAGNHEPDGAAGFRAGVVAALTALRKREVVRWLVLLQCSDLMGDVMLGYLALYFVDVAHVAPAEAGIAVAVWTGAGLAGGLLVIPLLERTSGLRYLRLSAVAALLLFPALLLVPGFGAKLVLLAAIGAVDAGWYPVLQGRLYTAMPGLSGTVTTVGNVFGLLGATLPLALGLAAQRAGLGATMWLLLIAPVAIMLGVPDGTPRPLND